ARALRHIAHRLGQRRVDIVHAHHDGGVLAGLLLKFMWRARAALRTTYVPLKHEWGHTAFGWLCRQLFSFGLFPLLLSAEVAVSPAYAEALERRRGRERKGRPVGRYLMCVHVRPHAIQIAVLEGRAL
ncbi:MAG: hypothetical protein C4294_17735, partial [Nitrospiraceae bacterium]